MYFKTNFLNLFDSKGKTDEINLLIQEGVYNLLMYTEYLCFNPFKDTIYFKF